ncbi:hypothetical protein LIPSTDRAFT_242194 [Lipomyces starkeyi NRRL Y-11557]|uniref:Uncharacterized protein n=1 Tax=Lipomyces starkeyi NRRL Y-11557 TaxID=675824 RepID=A0A1E3QC35_LIPST|nr:hypothetical protein LIPSTDRAFT_242194 [Lipomyces starkeyi NRRL Y-11557]
MPSDDEIYRKTSLCDVGLLLASSSESATINNVRNSALILSIGISARKKYRVVSCGAHVLYLARVALALWVYYI